MLSTYLLHAVLLSTLFTFSKGDEKADLALQKTFEEMTGDIASARDYCFQNTSTSLKNLKDYESADQVPENDLCFFKCFYEKTGIIDGNGKLVAESLNEMPNMKEYDADKLKEISQCVKGLDSIVTCADLRKAEKCFKKAA